MSPTSASSQSSWRTASIVALGAIVVLALVVGFVWIPYGQSGATVAGLWDAICRAAGVAVPWRAEQQPTDPVVRPSNVIVTPEMMVPVSAGAIGRGGTLALQCTMCHGARGVSEANSPNLAGQDAGSIYKQIRDYRSGHRPSAIMAPLVQKLSDQDMRDLAAYYASLPRPRGHAVSAEPAPAIVKNGAPMRNVAACDSCHHAANLKPGTPLLDGQPYNYLRAQLHAFTIGARRNDLHQQMRNVARPLTLEEIDAAARYYAGR